MNHAREFIEYCVVSIGMMLASGSFLAYLKIEALPKLGASDWISIILLWSVAFGLVLALILSTLTLWIEKNHRSRIN